MRRQLAEQARRDAAAVRTTVEGEPVRRSFTGAAPLRREVRGVREHPVELPSAPRQIGEEEIEVRAGTARPGRLEGAPVQVGRDDVGARRHRPGRELAGTGPHLEHALSRLRRRRERGEQFRVLPRRIDGARYGPRPRASAPV
jgi:hypothetical protein